MKIAALVASLVGAALAVVALPGGVAAAADQGHFDSPAIAQTGWVDSATPGKAYHADGSEDGLPLGARVDDAGVTHTARIYITFDLSAYEGKKPYGGHVFVNEGSAADCSKRSIEVWRTKPVASTPTWAKQPAELTKLDEIQTAEFCPRAVFTFDVGSAFSDAITHKQRLVTFEFRVSAEHESDPAYGRTIASYPGVRGTVAYNSVPVLDKVHLYNSGYDCSQLKPYRPVSSASLSAVATDADWNDSVRLNIEFAIWPVGKPDQRTSYTARATTGRAGTAVVPAAALTDGTSYAWQARATDGLDTTAWSKKCYFTYDGKAPSAPTLTSTNFPQNTWGPAGVDPVFAFDAHGDKDVAGFEWGWWSLGVPVCEYSGEYGQLVCPEVFSRANMVKADEPGGMATVTIHPDSDGPIRLVARAVDASGQRSSTVEYSLYIPSNQPQVTLDGNRPHRGQSVLLKLTPGSVANVSSYDIKVDGTDPGSRDADEDGTAYYSFWMPDQDQVRVEVRARLTNGFVTAPATWYASLDRGPDVSSDIYDGPENTPSGGVGQTGTFTFGPPSGWEASDVVGYRWDFQGDSSTATEVKASDGHATVTWTPTESGYQMMYVWAVRADGTLSDWSWYGFSVADAPAKAGATVAGMSAAEKAELKRAAAAKAVAEKAAAEKAQARVKRNTAKK